MLTKWTRNGVRVTSALDTPRLNNAGIFGKRFLFRFYRLSLRLGLLCPEPTRYRRKKAHRRLGQTRVKYRHRKIGNIPASLGLDSAGAQIFVAVELGLHNRKRRPLGQELVISSKIHYIHEYPHNQPYRTNHRFSFYKSVPFIQMRLFRKEEKFGSGV